MAQSERWQLAGNAPEIYQRELVPAIFGPWAPIVADLANLVPGERVLDIACGTGAVARVAAQRVGSAGQVIGMDLNGAMLKVARVSTQHRPQHAEIQWREANTGALPVPDESCDVVCCQLGLQYFPDRPAALREMRRVLVPEGRIVLMVWRSIDHCPGFNAMAKALDRHVSAAAGDVMRAPFALRDEAEIQVLLASAGFRNIAITQQIGNVRFASVEDLVRCQVAGSPLASHVTNVDDTQRVALVEEVKRALGGYITEAGLLFPIAAHLARARK
jgi:SAM-dependent methyltransferase